MLRPIPPWQGSFYDTLYDSGTPGLPEPVAPPTSFEQVRVNGVDGARGTMNTIFYDACYVSEGTSAWTYRIWAGQEQVHVFNIENLNNTALSVVGDFSEAFNQVGVISTIIQISENKTTWETLVHAVPATLRAPATGKLWIRSRVTWYAPPPYGFRGNKQMDTRGFIGLTFYDDLRTHWLSRVSWQMVMSARLPAKTSDHCRMHLFQFQP